jgi:co-chaperonin GroES (HSP10)
MNIKIEQIEMLGNRILVKPDLAKKHEIVSAGGLITASGKQLKSQEGIESLDDIDIPTGTIVAAGPECHTLKVGDKVLFSPFSGKVLTFMLDNYLLMSEPEPVLRVKE